MAEQPPVAEFSGSPTSGVLPLGVKFTDRTNPMDRHAKSMIEERGFEKAPPAAQFFGNAGREHMERHGTTPLHFAKIGWKNHKHSVNNPYSQFQDEYSLEDIQNAPMVFDPLTKLQCCPTSDGACALVLANEAGGRRAPRAPAWVHGKAIRSENGFFPGRDPVNPVAGQDCVADVYRQAGITDPRRELDMIECYVPFSWYEPMWMENLGIAEKNRGWELTDSGATAFDGDIPVNCSGGVLSTNPIGASGMLRFAEAALQVRGQAGERQVDGARRALGHAYGGAAQYFAMWVVGSERP